MVTDKQKEYSDLLRWYNLTKRLALLAAVLAIITSILLIANYIQTKSIDPLKNQALTQLMTEFQKDSGNELLKQQIRALDLLARKAYFTNQWQIRTGSMILFISVLILLVCLKYMNSLNLRLPDLEKTEPISASWFDQLLARKYIGTGALVLFAAAILAGILSENEFIASDSANEQTVDFPTQEELRANWPMFRGPEGNGIVYQSGFPVNWDGAGGQNIIWKTEIQLPGFNSPIIWQDRIFLAGADKENQVVYCVDRLSGRMIWQTSVNDVQGSPEKKPKVTDDTGYAAPTMTTDGKYVYVIYATGDLAALDFEGKIIWSKNLGVPDNHYGHSSSLIIYKNTLLIQFDHSDSKELIGLMAWTGAELFRTPREVSTSWASPMLFTFNGQTQLALNSNPFVISYNPETGKELWRVKCMDGEVAPSPAYADGRLFVVNEYARLAAVQLGDQPSVLWEYEDDLPEVSSPLATGELLFAASSYGVVTCFNSINGEVLWHHEFSEGFYSSPILADKNVYLIDMAGITHVFKASATFELVAESPLGEVAMTIPAFMNGRIYIRGMENLYCIGSDNE